MAVEKTVVENLIRRVDEMMLELASLREELRMILPHQPVSPLLTDALYGSLGHGQMGEYDSSDDWERFA